MNIKKGDWIYNLKTGRAGLVISTEEDKVQAVYPMPKIVFVYHVGSEESKAGSRKAAPIIEVLTTALAVITLLNDIIPVAQTLIAGIIRMVKSIIGSEEEKAAIKAFRKAKKVEKHMRKTLDN